MRLEYKTGYRFRDIMSSNGNVSARNKIVVNNDITGKTSCRRHKVFVGKKR